MGTPAGDGPSEGKSTCLGFGSIHSPQLVQSRTYEISAKSPINEGGFCFRWVLSGVSSGITRGIFQQTMHQGRDRACLGGRWINPESVIKSCQWVTSDAQKVVWWARQSMDMHHTLTTHLRKTNKKPPLAERRRCQLGSDLLASRGDRIRTCGILLPKR